VSSRDTLVARTAAARPPEPSTSCTARGCRRTRWREGGKKGTLVDKDIVNDVGRFERIPLTSLDVDIDVGRFERIPLTSLDVDTNVGRFERIPLTSLDVDTNVGRFERIGGAQEGARGPERGRSQLVNLLGRVS
jgi:hypothetical protein